MPSLSDKKVRGDLRHGSFNFFGPFRNKFIDHTKCAKMVPNGKSEGLFSIAFHLLMKNFPERGVTQVSLPASGNLA